MKGSVSKNTEDQKLQNRVIELERQLAEAQATILTLTSPPEDVAQASSVQDYARLLRELEQEKAHSAALAAVARQQLQELEAVFEAIPGAFSISRLDDGRIMVVNNSFEQLFGYSRKDVIGKTSLELSLFMESSDRQKAIERLRVQGFLRDFELSVRTCSGEGRPVSLSVEKISLDNEEHLLTIIHDLTTHKQAEQALHERERQYRELAETLQVERAKLEAAIENLPVGVGIEDAAGNTLSLNAAGLKLHGFQSEADMYSRLERYFEEFELRYLDGRLMPFEEWPAARALHGEFVQDYELNLQNKLTGTQSILSYSAAPVRNSLGEVVLIMYVIQDMTERKQAEAALRLSETRFRQLADSMPQLVWTARPDGTVDYYNRRQEEYHGLRPVEGDAWEWMPVLHPDDLQPTVEAWNQALASGETYQCEHRVRTANGAYRWHLSRGVPVWDEHGRIIRWFGTATDIHDLKVAEEKLKDYAGKLERSNRDLEEFAYVASHDLQEPLRKIEAFGSALAEPAMNLGAKQIDYIERMHNAAQRMRRMVDDLLALSRVESVQQPFRSTDLDRVAQQVLSTLEFQVKRTGGQVEVGGLPEVDADPVQMHQLLQNLIGNALKFHRQDVPPYVRVYTGQRTPTTVELIVEDNGIGFQVSEAERIFQPFQRLVRRHEYEGSGIGLAICRKIVERHNGSLTARSQPGQGATFIVTLPLRQSTAS